jgi:polar amino acid transport system substrate-binding protein
MPGMVQALARLFAALGLAAVLAAPAFAQSGGREVVVATRILPPVVVDRAGNLTGFSIDLWNRIAGRLRLKTQYQRAPDIGTLLQDVRAGTAELGVAAISITARREAEFEFSQPILDAGLQIMVRSTGKSSAAGLFFDLIRLLFSAGTLWWLGAALLLIVVPAHLVWWLERRHRDGIFPKGRYFPGICHAMYWSATTLITQAENQPRHWLARIIGLFWMFAGIAFVALYTAQLAAQLTVAQIQGTIGGPADLSGRAVATTRGSTAADVLLDLNANVTEVTAIGEAFRLLIDRKVDAVVFDAPVLLYFAANGGKGRVEMVGAPFHKESYGIVFRPNDPLRREVNKVLLTMREDGTYQQIYDRWFTRRD